MHWHYPVGGGISLALSAAMQHSTQPMLIVTTDNLSASRLLEELHFFNAGTVLPFPDWETLAYDHFSPHQDIISDRLSALFQLSLMQKGAVISTVATLMHRLPPQDYLDKYVFVLKIGDQLDIAQLRAKLIHSGYQLVGQVREHGEFAIRGSIIDLFPTGSRTPFRIDLFDNEVDSIRLFAVDTQRSLDKIESIHLLPAREFPLTQETIEKVRQRWRSQFVGNVTQSPLYRDISEGICFPGIEYYLPLFFDNTATLFDYLPENTTIVLLGDIQKQGNEFWDDVKARYEQRCNDALRPILPPAELFMSIESFNTAVNQHDVLKVNFSASEKCYHFEIGNAPALQIHYKTAKPLADLEKFLHDFAGRILFCVESLGRREVILDLFKSIDLHPVYFDSWQHFLEAEAQYGIVVSPLEEGFILGSPSLAVITETQLYGQRVMQRRLRKKAYQDPDLLVRDLTELKIDDPIVHIDHGVGRYRGLQTLNIGEQVSEFLTLEYQGGDKLYVPVTSLHLVSRYSGADSEHAPMNKLGTDHWHKAKRKAAEKVRDIAAELLELYAKRAARSGYVYTFPTEEYAALSAAFPFEETPDQLQAIEHVFSDMMSEKPMDRVICGDVGFGKTEVALRAAFVAIQNGKQVALLVPTTLLAQQHFDNFRNRLADWPIQIELLSRFRTPKETKSVLKKMLDGHVDLVIGTHKLIQTDIQFKSLGLVIVDEEHRFGVKQKEKLKALREMVDILTLTATPIPRTLNMSLSGIRDLSIIASPPAKRLSVKTFVHEYENVIVKEAIQREVMRGGQAYFLHNDISTIDKKAEEIKSLVPEARVAVAHGQQHERDLEKTMSEFYHRHFNVLVCSTIIESGIDIPTANTIIINRADKFGIAQLHQLRGRVGRSHHQAYAYLFTPPRKQMTKDAEKRLDAISAFHDLGVGFTLATHDLEIRGAGDLLGEEQSGEIHEIGFTLYMDLLSRAVDAFKSGKEPDLEKPFLQHGAEVDLHLSALIPESYLGDVQLRLQFYKRIANTKSQSELDDIQVEMIDRFGLLPEPIQHLFSIAQLKQKAQQLGIIKIDANAASGKLEFSEKPQVRPETIIRLIQQSNSPYKLEGPVRLRFRLPVHPPKERFDLINNILDELGA
ncbi:MAG TPA: transcription-repair coupling factor [Gammaproteobacteria bacterium]|jgi:transcription-repair coupling factor (superfamily II helicase)|nr:transcription-repair coupling factor [Gammaproteobacteria bacterium]